MIPSSKNKFFRNTSVLLLITLAVLLTLSVRHSMDLENQKAEITNLMQTQIDTLTFSNASLDADAYSKTDALEHFRYRNDSLIKVVNEGVSKIALKEQEIKNLKSLVKNDASKKLELMTKINELNELTDSYLDRIDQVLVRNKGLKAEEEELTRKLERAGQNLPRLEHKMKANTASLLKVEYLGAAPLKKKILSDQLEPTGMARRVIRIKTCLRLPDNKLAPPGIITIRIRILAPDGKVVGNPVDNSGKFTTAEGKELQYTVSKEVNYTGENIELCEDYDEPSKGYFSPGTYTIEIYANGTLASTSALLLR
jgi:hypothetical protein